MHRSGAPLALGLLALLLSTLLVSGPAAAQGDTCAANLAAAEDNPSTSGFERDVSRTFTFVITNTGQITADIVVAVTDPPPGWFWSSDDRRVSAIASGSTAEVSYQIFFSGDRAVPAQMEVRLEEVECRVGGVGGFSVQGTRGAPAAVAFSANTPTTGGIERGTSLAWIVFGLIVLGTVVAVPLVYRSRRIAVEAFCEEAERTVIAGRGTSFPIVLRNKASQPAHLGLEVTEVKEGWSALVTLPELELAAKESRTIYMMVRAPAEARTGDLCVAKLTVRPEGGSPQTVTTLTRVVPVGTPGTGAKEPGKGKDKKGKGKS